MRKGETIRAPEGSRISGQEIRASYELLQAIRGEDLGGIRQALRKGASLEAKFMIPNELLGSFARPFPSGLHSWVAYSPLFLARQYYDKAVEERALQIQLLDARIRNRRNILKHIEPLFIAIYTSNAEEVRRTLNDRNYPYDFVMLEDALGEANFSVVAHTLNPVIAGRAKEIVKMLEPIVDLYRPKER